jgi:hypothetical protein
MTILPTWSKPNGKVYATFRDQVIDYLKKDKKSTTLNMYFYAITKAGWDYIWPFVDTWKMNSPNREVFIYCGLANWVTDPNALTEMLIKLPQRSFVVTKRKPVFHPKAFIFNEKNYNTCFLGSNNLSGPGLSSNYELGVSIKYTNKELAKPKGLATWEKEIRSIAVPLTYQLHAIYKEEYDKMARLPRNPGVIGKKQVGHPILAKAAGLPDPGVAIMEVMPKETGSGGTQLQIPLEVARAFFHLPSGKHIIVNLKDESTGVLSSVKLTDFYNKTSRLSISRLASEPKPRMIWFKKQNGKYIYNIVSKKINPKEYERLLLLCPFQTSSVSKHWGMYEEDPESSFI